MCRCDFKILQTARVNDSIIQWNTNANFSEYRFK